MSNLVDFLLFKMGGTYMGVDFGCPGGRMTKQCLNMQ